ncbi:MAG: hypothetical protein AAF311_06480 [Pseudomonadota bacterium]
MAIIRVRSISPFHREDFLARVFKEIGGKSSPEGKFQIGKSLSWRGFNVAASREDLAAICTNALDFREPGSRPDRKAFTAFRLSLGTHLLGMDLPFTRSQLRVLGESVVMQLKACNDDFPADRIGKILKERSERLARSRRPADT